MNVPLAEMFNHDEQHRPSHEVVSFGSVLVPHGDIDHTPSLFIEMEIKLLPPLWAQRFRHHLQMQRNTLKARLYLHDRRHFLGFFRTLLYKKKI